MTQPLSQGQLAMQECLHVFHAAKGYFVLVSKKRSKQRNFIDFFVIVAVLLQPRRPWKVAFIPSIAATSTTVVDFIWFNFLDDEHNSLLETPFRSSSNPYQAFFIHLLFSKALRMQVLTRVPLSFLYCSN